MSDVSQHFVTFYSPGTFVAEESRRPIEAWDPQVALAMAGEVEERYGARPYGFRFTTRGRQADDLDSRETARSPMYYFGGKVETLAEIEARNLDDERILRSNMQSGGWDRVFVTTTGWKWTQPLGPDDVVLETEAAA